MPMVDETANVSVGGDVRDWICLKVGIAGSEQGNRCLWRVWTRWQSHDMECWSSALARGLCTQKKALAGGVTRQENEPVPRQETLVKLGGEGRQTDNELTFGRPVGQSRRW